MAPRRGRTESKQGIPIPASIFRAYDIRGIVDEQLTEDCVKQISRGIGSEALAHGIDTLLVGFDGRLSSPSLSEALIAGLLSTGCNVVNLGMVPTPLLYYASHTSGFESGVMLTASHNPANYNGLKVVFKQTCLADNQIQKIRQRVEQGPLRDGAGSYAELDIQSQYIEAICSSVSLGRKLKLGGVGVTAVAAVGAP